MEEQEQKQKYMERYCKVCNQNRLFVTSLSPTGTFICCICRYAEPMVPFKLITDNFGHRIVSGGN